MAKKGRENNLGMPNPRTPEDNINLNGLIYSNLLGGKPHQSLGMQTITFLIGLVFFLPLTFTVFNLINNGGPIEFLNMVFNLILATPGLFVMYRVFKR